MIPLAAAIFATIVVAINVATIIYAARKLERYEQAELRGPLVVFNACAAVLLASLLWWWWGGS